MVDFVMIKILRLQPVRIAGHDCLFALQETKSSIMNHLKHKLTSSASINMNVSSNVKKQRDSTPTKISRFFT